MFVDCNKHLKDEIAADFTSLYPSLWNTAAVSFSLKLYIYIVLYRFLGGARTVQWPIPAAPTNSLHLTLASPPPSLSAVHSLHWHHIYTISSLALFEYPCPPSLPAFCPWTALNAVVEEALFTTHSSTLELYTSRFSLSLIQLQHPAPSSSPSPLSLY